MWVKSNTNLDAAKELNLTGIKKYWVSEIKLDWLYDQILVLATFVRYLYKMYNNEKVTKNRKVRQDMDSEQVSHSFVQLYESIQYQKMESKDISDVTKLVKKHAQYLMIWGTSG